MRRTLLIAAAVAALAAASQAQAHARLLHATPAIGATVHSPAGLTLAFSETIVPASSTVALTGPGGRAIPTGHIALDPKDPRMVTVSVGTALVPGLYHVNWGMTAADGHHSEGTFVFKVQ
jgi:methionine-rich copper-binding protein CopC